jgi:hypothetical protein
MKSSSWMCRLRSLLLGINLEKGASISLVIA